MEWKSNKFLGTIIIIATLFTNCSKHRELPVLGPREAVQEMKDGRLSIDTVYHTIPEFSFTNQDGLIITEQKFKDRIYIADFFFTTCPTICPVMKSQLLRVYEKYLRQDKVMILSHTIDPVHDSVRVLHEYANRLDVSSNKWHFVTGAKDSIYRIAQSYMVSAMEDKNAPGGFIHSGALILIDKNRHIRGYYDGTKEEKVTQLLEDIDVLLDEK